MNHASGSRGVTTESMDADAQTAHAVENAKLRAKGIDTLAGDDGRAAFMLGFADGAMWAIENAKQVLIKGE